MEGVPRRGTTAVDVEKMKASDRAARVAQAPQQHRRLCSRATPREPTFTCLVRIRNCRSDGHSPLPRIAQTKKNKLKPEIKFTNATKEATEIESTRPWCRCPGDGVVQKQERKRTKRAANGGTASTT